MRNRDHLFLAGGLLFALTLALPVHAQDGNDPVPARVRYFEGTVTVQRAHAAETSPALVNLPVDAGDRLWTDEQGRVELTLGDGTTVWLDHLTTIDIVALPRAEAGDTIIRLWGGSIIAERPGTYDRREQVLRVDTADAAMVLRPQGSYRIDLDDEHRTWLSVYDGNATMAGGGLTEIIAAGETTYVEPGTAPAEVADFNTAENDDFSSWQIDRWLALAETQKHVRDRDYVPAEARPYAADLERHGSWIYYDDFSSYAWRPSVGSGWAPYRDGRWVYSYAGWTWVPYASWGWATVHYGRWHHTPSYGWMWFPGSVYSPGWVSWYAGSGYLGWSPIGYYNRPFLSVNLFFGGHYGYGNGYHGGRNYDYAVRRGGKAVAGRGYARDLDADHGWTFVNADHFGTGKRELRATARSAVPRQATGNAVSFEGSLRSRKPSVLASVASSRGVGGSSRSAFDGSRSAFDGSRGAVESSRGAFDGSRGATVRDALPSRGTPERGVLVAPRGSEPRPDTAQGSGSSVRRAAPRGTSPGGTVQPPSGAAGGERAGASQPGRGSARPRTGSPSRVPPKPRAGSSGRSRSGSAASPRTSGSSDSNSAALSRRPSLPTRADLTGASTSRNAAQHPLSLSRSAISRYAPQTSRYQPQTSSYQPDTSRYQPRSGDSQPTITSSRTPQQRYQPAAPRYAPSTQARNGFGYRPPTSTPQSFSTPRSASTPRSLSAPRSASTPRSFSTPRSASTPRSFSAPRSFSTPRGPAISSRGSGRSSRSFSAPSRSRSSGRSATRRSGGS